MCFIPSIAPYSAIPPFIVLYIYYFFLTTFLLFCTLLSSLVLVQESKSFGLGASFGGEASSLLGTSTAQVLKTFTAWCGLIFIVFSFLLSIWTSALETSAQRGDARALQKAQL